MRATSTLFLLALASIPIQLNKFFFMPYSYVLGLPIDYRAPSIYFSDLTVLTFTFSFFWQNRHRLHTLYISYKNFILALVTLNVYLIVNAFITRNTPGPAFFFSFKILEFSLFCLAATDLLKDQKIKKTASLILMFSLFWESLLLIGQFLRQASIGFYFLGERTFSSATPSIAHVDLFGSQLLRPYGTFPHPNVAAAFLLISALILTIINKANFFKKYMLLFIPITVSFIMAVSKTAAASTILAALALTKKPQLVILGALMLLTSLFWLKNLPETQLATISERITLIQAATDIAAKNPIFGVGSGNFIASLATLNLFTLTQIRLLQPVHNVFFLILSENGLIGLLIFSYLLFAVAKFAITPQKIALFITLLVLASFDHFLWTLQQGQLLLWLSIAVIASRQQVKKSL